MASQPQASTIDTRLGTLTLESGFPTLETAKKLYDEIDFSRATQAFIWVERWTRSPERFTKVQ